MKLQRFAFHSCANDGAEDENRIVVKPIMKTSRLCKLPKTSI